MEELNKSADFSWLNKYRNASSILIHTGYGYLCVGMQDIDNRYFCKIVGVDTIEAEYGPQETASTFEN